MSEKGKKPSESAIEEPAAQPNETRITRFLHVVEWLGNALPHPVSLFALFAVGVVVLSGILGSSPSSIRAPWARRAAPTTA
jgi:aminobenzoyl-glutamate transport protein